MRLLSAIYRLLKRLDERFKLPVNLVGLLPMALGLLTCFGMMAKQGQTKHATVWGFLALLVGAVGIVHFWAGFHAKEGDDGAPSIGTTVFGRLEDEPPWMTPTYGVLLAVVVFTSGWVIGGVEQLPWTILASLATLLPASIRRPGLFVFVVVSAIYLPMLGTYSLFDPWETHYGEVSREILARDDWISLWWAQEEWFWSKPILIFWSEALTMSALGVDFLPDANPTAPEWALRLPIFGISMGAIMTTYFAMAKIWSRRAGVLCAFALASMPYFFFLAHQSITDMPFVGNATVAMGMLMMALREDPERKIQNYRVGPLVVSWKHAVMAVIALISLPQVLYLISRNITLVWPEGGGLQGFAFHGDEFLYGSAGNMGVPGNDDHKDVAPFASSLIFQPISQGILWGLGLTGLMFVVSRERRVRSLYMFGFYTACGLAFMGKGIPGFALPGLVALLYLVASRRWHILLEGHLRIGIGALNLIVVGLPWYVAMYMRHGPRFTDRLLVHDHINRLASGVHGDKGSIQYFVEQLGFGLFPWVALVPPAAALWLWRRGRIKDEAEDHRSQNLLFVGLWFTAAFVLFSAMITKFHHYIFPVVPPAGILCGLLVHELWGSWKNDRRQLLGSALACIAPACAIVAVAGFWGDIRGVIPVEVMEAEGGNPAQYVLDNPTWGRWSARLWMFVAGVAAIGAVHLLRERRPAVEFGARRYLYLAAAVFAFLSVASAGLAVVGLAALLIAMLVIGRTGEDTRPPAHAALSVVFVVSAVIAAFIGRDIAWFTGERPEGHERLINLFVYNYKRPFPEYLDYRPVFTGFAIVAACVIFFAAFRTLQRFASRAFVATALLFASWVVNVYLIDVAPHWGQRVLVKRYYEERANDDEHLIGWQMNWKGENFYTGNRVYAFVSLKNEEIKKWMDGEKGNRHFFMMEHSRVGNFKRMMGSRQVDVVTTKRDCNKFVLVQATL